MCWLGAQTTQVTPLHPDFPDVSSAQASVALCVKPQSAVERVYLWVSNRVSTRLSVGHEDCVELPLLPVLFYYPSPLGFSVSHSLESCPSPQDSRQGCDQCFFWASFLRSSSEAEHQDSGSCYKPRQLLTQLIFYSTTPGSGSIVLGGESDG